MVAPGLSVAVVETLPLPLVAPHAVVSAPLPAFVTLHVQLPNPTPAGGVSVTTASVTPAGPLFTIVSVYVTTPPDATVPGAAITVSARSAIAGSGNDTTVSTSLAVSFAPFVSITPLGAATAAPFVTEPLAAVT